MSITEKLTTIAEDVSKVYEAGFKAATLTGTTTFTDASKTLVITGLKQKPKQINIYASTTESPENDEQYFIRGLDYEADGFYYGTSTIKILACVWFAVHDDVASTNAGNGSITERQNNKDNIFSYDNGIFTIKMVSTNQYYFGKNYTYRWTMVF